MQVWSDNEAWEDCDTEEAGEGYCVPLRFVLRWKPTEGGGTEANARIVLQGYKHKDVIEKVLGGESPTLSKFGRHFVYTILVERRYHRFAADVKSVFHWFC